MPSIELVLAGDPSLLLERAAEAFLMPLRATPDRPFPSPPYLLALRQGGLRDDLFRLAADRGVPGWFDPPLCTFQELPARLGGTGRVPCDDFERVVILGGVLRQFGGDVFGRLQRPQDFIGALDRLFGDLVAEGVDPAALRAALEARTDRDAFERSRAALGRWDPASPAPDSEPGREHRGALAREIAAVRGHPGYRALDDAAGSRRELEFVHLVSGEGFLQGKIDLAAPEDRGVAALDVKTGGGDAEALKRKAEGYALQRSVYVGAIEAVGGRPVTRFAFHFAADGVQVGGPLTAEIRARASGDVREALATMGDEAPGLTVHPAECRFCGYRKVKWCEGVRQ